jgi:hypothetical protein
MAKETGLGWTTCSVDDSGGSAKTIINDVNSLEISTPIAVLEVTGIDKSAMERLHGLADASVTLDGTFNDATGQSHDTFTPLTGARTVTNTVSGNTLAMEMLATDYSLSRGDDGSLKWKVPLSLADGTLPAWT